MGAVILLDNKILENQENDMSAAARPEIKTLKSVGFITGISGNGAKALCDVGRQ
jgi:hypothetical protein